MKLQEEVKNDMVSGFWNEIDLPGQVKFIGAGYCTSFVVTQT
jgi:protein ATS1